MTKLSIIQAWLTAKTENDERGAGLAEYALLLFLIAVACLGALGALSGAIQNVYNQVAGAL
ncbi:MAG: Flp family type IVb pilin [Acidimicrobiales bacterium]